MIGERTVQRVKELSVVDVLCKYVQLKRQGANYVCCCPFHGEKTPSLNVSPNKNLWHCFGCDRGGDAIAFVMEHQNVDFQTAVEEIAKANGVPIEYVVSERSEERIAEAKLRESLLIAIEQVQEYFVNSLSACTDGQSYAFNRWGEDFCHKVGIGFAPKSSAAFLDWCKNKALNLDLLLELGLVKKSEKDGSLYAFFRNRVTIPIRNRSRKIIGFTARDITGAEKAKYINSTTSKIFAKGEVLFGIDEAANAARKEEFVIGVEGAPDVLRLQSVGLENAVATLGTAWTDKHFDELGKVTKSICFIPDSDVPHEGQDFGAGINAVIRNGEMAMRHGFSVTVRELPFGEDDEGGEVVKNDADSYISCKDDFTNLEEKHFVVWLAEKRFPLVKTQVARRKLVTELTSLLACIDDKMIIADCIEQLAKIDGKQRQWRDLLKSVKEENRRKNTFSLSTSSSLSPKTAKEREAELLSKFGLFIRDNMYFSVAEDEPVRLSNFILEPMYHVKDEYNGTRIFKIRNEYNQEEVIEFHESDLVSLSNFQQKVGSLGNFIWKAKIDKLNVVKELLYTLTDSALLIKQMGWDAVNEFYAWGNGILKDGMFLPVDDLGIVRLDDRHKYYIPATSVMYRQNPAVFQFERMFKHENRSAITLYDFTQKVIDVFGDNGKVGVCFLFASMFRDIIYPIKNCFPLLNLFGLKGTGKTSLATTLQSFFIHSVDPPSIGIASIPSMNDRVSQVTNAMVVFDEYKNDLDERKIAYLKALWGGAGQTKKNMNGDGKAAQTVVTSAVVICGQDLPTRDIALYSRVIHLTFSRPSFSAEERRRFDDLKEISNLGNTHLAVQVLNLRKVMENGYRQNHSIVRKELSNALTDEEIEDRVLDNWVVPLATFRTLESSLRLPFTYAEMFDITIAGIRYQNEGCKKNTEMADFWEVIDSLHSQGRIIDKAHFKIRYLTEFRGIGSSEPIVFAKPTQVLFLNPSAVAALYTGRIAGGAVGKNTGNWGTVLTYLKVQPSFLGLKQDRFNILLPNGALDYTIDSSGGIPQKKLRVNRPKALCFDYGMLKDKYAINLETSTVSEADLDADELPAVNAEATPPTHSLNPQQEELPF